MRFIGHALWLLPGLAAAALIWGVSAAVNWRFGLSLGTSASFDLVFFKINTAQVFSSASFACDILKTCLPFSLVAAIQGRHSRASIVILAALVLSVFWSLSSALGFAALNHSATTDLRGKDIITWNTLTSQIERLEKRRQWIPDSRPFDAVRAERVAREQNYLYAQTKSCTDATLPISISYCNDLNALKIEEGNAAAIIDTDRQLERLRLELKNTPKVSSESPRDEMFSYMTGFGEKSVSAGYGVYFALMMEVIASMGFWMLCTAYSAATRGKVQHVPVAKEQQKKSQESLEIGEKKAEPETPLVKAEKVEPKPAGRVYKLALVPGRLKSQDEIDVVTRNWIEQRMERVDVNQHGCAANILHEDYKQYCAGLSKPVAGVNPSLLGKSIRRLNVPTKRLDDGAHWGLRLKAGRRKAA